jgi:acyl carrier protein
MTERDITARIQRIFEQSFDIRAPAPQTDIIDAALIDSVALVAFLFEIEKQFGMAIPLESLQVDDFRTIESIARLVG